MNVCLSFICEEQRIFCNYICVIAISRYITYIIKCALYLYLIYWFNFIVRNSQFNIHAVINISICCCIPLISNIFLSRSISHKIDICYLRDKH